MIHKDDLLEHGIVFPLRTLRVFKDIQRVAPVPRAADSVFDGVCRVRVHLERARSEIRWEHGWWSTYLVDLKIHIVVKKELPDMGELSCLECAVREGGPRLEDFGMDVRRATLEKAKGARHRGMEVAYLCSNLGR